MTKYDCSFSFIDIIACLGRCLAFVEVKTRDEAIAQYFPPLEGISKRKREKLRRLAEIYFAYHGDRLSQWGIEDSRFDAISVIYRRIARTRKTIFRVEHLEDAFA